MGTSLIYIKLLNKITTDHLASSQTTLVSANIQTTVSSHIIG